MNAKTTFALATALAATLPRAAAAESHFVLFDNMLNAPALYYPLRDGWSGMGWIKWIVPAKTNPYLQSTILMNPSEHRIVQEAGAFNQGSFVLEQVGNIYSDANAMTAHLAKQINSSIVVKGLANFTPKYGRFGDSIPPHARRAVELALSAIRTATFKKAFTVECHFDCDYCGMRCEAVYESTCVFSAVQVRPTLPTIATVLEFDRFLTVAPPGDIAETKRVGGRMLAGAFVNRNWKYAAERMAQAILRGQLIGMNEGQDLMRQAQAENERVMANVRRQQSEMIREVKTVDNPLTPGEQIERPIHFDHSWINSTQDAMILSDTNLDPHEVRKLVGRGAWTPVD